MTTVVKTIYDKDRIAAFHVTGTGSDAGTAIVDVSTLKGAGVNPNVRIRRVTWTNTDGTLLLSYDATADLAALWFGIGSDTYNDDGNWPSVPSAVDDGEAGATGDILLTKTGTGSYSLIIEVIKVSGFTETDVHIN